MVSAPGKNFLFVVGILYIVFAGIGLLVSAGGLLTADYWDSVFPTASGMSWSVYYQIAIVGSFFHVFVGIMGVVNRARLEKASMLRVLACIDIAYVVFGAVLGSMVFAGAFGGFVAVFSLAVGLVLPILYFIGAQKNLAVYSDQYRQ